MTHSDPPALGAQVSGNLRPVSMEVQARDEPLTIESAGPALRTDWVLPNVPTTCSKGLSPSSSAYSSAILASKLLAPPDFGMVAILRRLGRSSTDQASLWCGGRELASQALGGRINCSNQSVSFPQASTSVSSGAQSSAHSASISPSTSSSAASTGSTSRPKPPSAPSVSRSAEREDSRKRAVVTQASGEAHEKLGFVDSPIHLRPFIGKA